MERLTLIGAALVLLGGIIFGQRTDLARLEGAAVAVIEHPGGGIIRATMPVPLGLFHGEHSSGSVPFQVYDAKGVRQTTQVRRVSRYPDGSADVLEVLARIPEAGRAYVLRQPTRAPRFVPSAPARELLGQRGRLLLRARDAQGGVYEFDIGAALGAEDPPPGATPRVLATGPLVRMYRVAGAMRPVGRAPHQLPHLFGVQAYVSSWSAEGFLSIDLHVHNGLDGRTESPLDDPLEDVFFDSLELVVPAGWGAAAAFDADGPRLGPYPVVRRQGGGKLHALRSQGRLLRRLAVYKGTDQRARALEEVREGRLGFVVPARNSRGATWSWQNPKTARYLPQAFRLPFEQNLEPVRAQLSQDFRELEAAVLQGRPSSSGFPLISGALGYAHPYGARHGGMTGGWEIHLSHGVAVAQARSRDGYLLELLKMRTRADRQPTALYQLHGDPSSVEEWLVRERGLPPYCPPFVFLRPQLALSDPWGWKDAPVQAVAPERVPGYLAGLKAYKPVDFQHYTRWTAPLEVAVWLGGDPMAAELLEASAEVARLSYHQHPNKANGVAQTSGMLHAARYVRDYPGWGFRTGRGPGWILDACAAAYRVGSGDFRARSLPWFDAFLDLVEAGQSTCTGLVQRTTSSKMYGGEHAFAQTYEAAIHDNALLGMLESVYRGEHERQASRTSWVLSRSLAAMIGPSVWRDELGGPTFNLGVGPGDRTRAPYCEPGPAGTYSTKVERRYVLSSLAAAERLGFGPQFMDRARQLIGPLEGLATTDPAKMDDHAPLRAAAQTESRDR